MAISDRYNAKAMQEAALLLLPKGNEDRVKHWIAARISPLLELEEPQSDNAFSPKMENGRLVLSLYAPISNWPDEFFGMAATPDQFVAAFKEVDPDVPATINIDSPGGAVYAMQTMVAEMDRQKSAGRSIDTNVDGMAASSASVIFANGDKRTMTHGSRVLIHNAHMMIVGNATFLERSAKVLRDHDSDIAERYAKAAGGKATKARFLKLMEEDTSLTPRQAKELGLATDAETKAETEQLPQGSKESMLRLIQAQLAGLRPVVQT